MKAATRAPSGGAKTKRRTQKDNKKSAAKECTKDSPDYGRRIVQALRQISHAWI
jgi:hypothetical protein